MPKLEVIVQINCVIYSDKSINSWTGKVSEYTLSAHLTQILIIHSISQPLRILTKQWMSAMHSLYHMFIVYPDARLKPW